MEDSESERLAKENQRIAEQARTDAERMNIKDEAGEANREKREKPADQTDSGEKG